MKRNENIPASGVMPGNTSGQCTGDGSGNGRCRAKEENACQEVPVPGTAGDKKGKPAGGNSWLLLGPDIQL